MTRPTVSVLTTSYNHGRWLADTLGSVACQTYPAVEHIVVDDGSTDNSLAVLAGFSAGDRLTYVTQENEGQAAALNRAFAMSSGDVIGWLSSDDAYYSPNVLAEVVDAFRADPAITAVYGHAVIIDADGTPLFGRWCPPPWGLFFDVAAFSFAQPALFVRRSAVGDMFVDESLDVAMDAELMLRVRGRGRLARLPLILAAERHHASRKSLHLGQLAELEHGRLATRGLEAPRGATWRARANASWAIYRLLGLTLMRKALRTPPAFSRGPTTLPQMARRQLFVRRADVSRGR